MFRCHKSSVCLHPDHMCDGIKQCPEQDDELLCDLVCPSVCHCQGLAFRCYHTFNISTYPHLRYIDASDSNVSLQLFQHQKLLIHIHLQNCSISNGSLAHVPNLRTLDLSSNDLRNGIPELDKLQRLSK